MPAHTTPLGGSRQLLPCKVTSEQPIILPDPCPKAVCSRCSMQVGTP
jgi:hypothetical protein